MSMSHQTKVYDGNRLFAVQGHVTTATLNLSAMLKWHPEMERAG